MISKKVYIIILNWNHWRDTAECLESVFQNDYDNYQVVVCDNASSDGSMEKLKQWATGKVDSRILISKDLKISLSCEKPISFACIASDEITKEMKKHNESLIFIDNGRNLGFAGGNNTGIRFALCQGDCDYVWILNNDTVVEKSALCNLLRKVGNDSGIGICGSRLMYYHEPDKIQSLGGTYNKFLGTTRHIHKPEQMNNIDYIVGASMLVPSKFLKTVGFMSEDYFLYYEDMDWSLNAVRNHFRIACALDSVVYHKEGASIGGNDYDKGNKGYISDYYSIRNRILFSKHYFKRYLPTVYLGLFVTMINRIRRKQFDRIRMILRIVLHT